MGGARASRGVNLRKDLRENPENVDHQEALRLWMAYSQIETRAQFVRLLGLGASGCNLTRRWEKNPTDALAQRPGAVSLRRMIYLVVWQMTGVLYISDLDEVDWNRMFIYPRDELKPPVSPFLKVVGGWPLAVPHGNRSCPLPLRRTSLGSHCASWGNGTTLSR